ncbi:hypothetical protein PMG71_23455 [Roseofilum sp. BLCC_M154]|uniref:Transposase n=1 Tax=Roseofilum acuticapitatum BLCC-M154 TaxID=3022444 RepID=A0ABT7AZS5_9CYAN|nr:hypothetical protein [Roseofilum acuticapitatum]MDJ1172391.1 hypothetical protein [Roseofilum acuticapitatum BLCC-M154]
MTDYDSPWKEAISVYFRDFLEFFFPNIAYEQKLWGCCALLKFPRVKLLDYDLSQLEQDSNPFAAIVAAHRTAQQMGEDVQQNYQRKLQLVKSLYQRGLSRNDIVELFRLIDWFIALPAKEEQRLWTEIESLEKEDQMPYITSVERFGIKKARQEDIVRILEVRFGEILSSLREQVSQMTDLEALERLVVQALSSQSLEAFQSELNSLMADETE